ncbi:hypothetical protein DXG01_015613 [Tephrocybe rancida]|nr:hypothetical protein DXG01_015613 [Tephrocybe rancida]
MPTNLIFLGLHFVIGKREFKRAFVILYLIELGYAKLTVYANSVLASLNTRKELRSMRTRPRPWVPHVLPLLSTSDASSSRRRSAFSSEAYGLPDPMEVYMAPTKAQKVSQAVSHQ